MNLLPGYQIIETLHASSQKVIYRAIRERDRLPVAIKTLKAEYPPLEEITRIQHEYQIAQNLALEGVVRTLGLEKERNGFALILEDLGGQSLDRLIKVKRLQVLEVLSIAVQVIQAIARLHEHNIIHKDIKPSNLIVNSATGQIKITDFSVATRLPREIKEPENCRLLEGTLAYMSPEQTGRMNRALDYRSDFYSLGATLYEMLVGQLPFPVSDPLELIHCHLAVTPIPPHQLNPEIPPVLSAIVMKLLAKNAEDRYQSAFGIQTDLEFCLEQLQEKGYIDEFVLGQRDRTAQFLIPQKLYGREQEVAELLDAFARIAGSREAEVQGRRGDGGTRRWGDEGEGGDGEKLQSKIQNRSELILVAGYSGVGKTAVINEIHKPIVEKRGYFISGKFDQLKRDIPYSAFIQAFRSLIQQLLTEPPEQIACWKEKLLERLGSNGQLIVNVIPDIELIIGSQPPVPEVGPTEAQYRFNLVFQQFVGVFAQPKHPLVIFLDDLQWADSGSLKSIELLTTDSNLHNLLLVGAYRDNEVSATHPLADAIAKIQENGAIVNKITLQPLDFNCVNQLIADTFDCRLHCSQCDLLHCQLEKQKPLSELLFHQTGGNPFFLVQLLQTLHAEKLFTFDVTTGCWLWDIEQIKALGFADYDAVELVARNLGKLPLQTQQILQLAACMGNRFNLDLLAAMNGELRTQVAENLWPALQVGFVVPSSEITTSLFSEEATEELAKVSSHHRAVSYKFLHDRVQQAAYSLIPEAEKQQIHLKIGQLLLQQTPAEELEENVFDIVNQLNFGANLIADSCERIHLAELNLLAGKKAKAASAYSVALQYCNTGLNLLPRSGWQTHYNLTYNLHLEALEAEYTNANFEPFNQLAEAILDRAQTTLEKVKVYELKISVHFSQNLMQEALDTGLEILRLLGIDLPQNPNKLHILLELAKTKLLQGRKQIEDLANLPEMTDSYKIAAMRILKAISPVTFVTRPDLYPLVILKMVNLSVRYGNSPMSCVGYCCLGIIYCAVLGNVENGYRYGKLGLQLSGSLQVKEIKSFFSALFNTFIRHWKEPIRATLTALTEGIKYGQETGDIENASHCATFYCSYLFLSGEFLETVNTKQVEYMDSIGNYKQVFQLYQIQVWNQVVLILKGGFVEEVQVAGEQFNKNSLRYGFSEAKNDTGAFVAYLAKILLFYWFKDCGRALENAALAEKYEQGAMGTAYIPVFKLYYSLALLSLYPNASKQEQKQYLKKVAAHQKKMKHWATHCPENYLHKYELVKAEKARVLGQDEKASQYYDRAIQGAKEQGYLQEEALGNELAAEFYFSRGREKLARLYLTDAYYGYLRWGANAKVDDLRSRYPEYLSQFCEAKTPENDVLMTRKTHSTASREGSALLDLTTVMKASQAISGEIVLEKLLHQLMQIAMENAGAQKGFLFLNRDESLILAAEAAIEPEKEIILPFMRLSECQNVPLTLMNYLQRTKETVVLNNAITEGLFINDPYIIEHRPQSILGLPILYQGKLTGILYLENRLARGAFTWERLEVLSLLSTQAAISIENSLLYSSLEEKVAERTQELNEKNSRLEQTLEKLKTTQLQLIQSEKMSSLGQLVAGVAHEINNPVSFISGNLIHTEEYARDLLDLLQLYQKYYPNSAPEIEDKLEEIDLEFLVEDLDKMLGSMKVGATRIQKIVESLRNFSRLDESEMKSVNIHEGIDNALAILQNRLRIKAHRPEIEVITNYGKLPQVECYVSDLNQVFMNILSNAIDALEEPFVRRPSSLAGGQERRRNDKAQISIHTDSLNNNWISIRIADNGIGMTEEVKNRVFDPFFTTKPVGKGTGMGMALSYQIVVDRHKGKLECVSTIGKGTEFIVWIPIRQS